MQVPEWVVVVIGYISVFFLLCSNIIFWSSSLKKNTKLRHFGYYLILLLGTEFFSKITYHLEINNLWMLHLYTLLELIILSLFYREILEKKITIFWITIITGILTVLNTVLLQGLREFNSNARTLEQIIIIIYTLLFFFTYPTQETKNKVLDQSVNLINSAILIYFSGSLFIFMFSQLFIDKKEIYLAFWSFNASLAVIFQVLVFISLWRIAFRKQT